MKKLLPILLLAILLYSCDEDDTTSDDPINEELTVERYVFDEQYIDLFGPEQKLDDIQEILVKNKPGSYIRSNANQILIYTKGRVGSYPIKVILSDDTLNFESESYALSNEKLSNENPYQNIYPYKNVIFFRGDKKFRSDEYSALFISTNDGYNYKEYPLEKISESELRMNLDEKIIEHDEIRILDKDTHFYMKVNKFTMVEPLPYTIYRVEYDINLNLEIHYYHYYYFNPINTGTSERDYSEQTIFKSSFIDGQEGEKPEMTPFTYKYESCSEDQDYDNIRSVCFLKLQLMGSSTDKLTCQIDTLTERLNFLTLERVSYSTQFKDYETQASSNIYYIQEYQDLSYLQGSNENGKYLLVELNGNEILQHISNINFFIVSESRQNDNRMKTENKLKTFLPDQSQSSFTLKLYYE